MFPLEEAFPDFLTGDGIFQHMYTLNFPFIPDTDTAQSLDIEYLFNVSGRKMASPMVARMVDPETGGLVTSSVEMLAKLAATRFSAKWAGIWREISSENGFGTTINVTAQTDFGKTIDTDGEYTLTKAGTETVETGKTGDDTRTEESDSNSPYTTEKKITGKYTDTSNNRSTRTGKESIEESFPTPRTSTKLTTGKYADIDTTANTRTGTQTTTNKGDTLSSVFGFNSNSPVGSSQVGPADSNGITEELSFGQNGLKDTKSGAITRTYGGDGVEGLTEAVTESGSRKTETTFGENGLIDTESGGTTRSYDNYKESETETGKRSIKTDYNSTVTAETSFDERVDTKGTDETIMYGGSDSTQTSGYDYRGKSRFDLLKAISEYPDVADFFKIVYADLDTLLTCPVFM